MLLLGIIGHPLGHTLSPVLHNWALSQTGLSGSYHVWDMTPERLPAFMSALRTLPIEGLSVTIPHKEAVMPLVDHLTDTARNIGAVNTLFWKDGALWGENTDVTGFMAPIAGLVPGTALVLGAGGAARAVLYGLRQAGWTVLVTARTDARANTLAACLQCEYLSWSRRAEIRPDLLVNTTPLGMAGAWQALSPWEASLDGIAHVYDLIYNPRLTPLLIQARYAGSTVISGLPMFVGQALAQFKLWTGQTFDQTLALNLLEQTLAS